MLRFADISLYTLEEEEDGPSRLGCGPPPWSSTSAAATSSLRPRNGSPPSHLAADGCNTSSSDSGSNCDVATRRNKPPDVEPWPPPVSYSFRSEGAKSRLWAAYWRYRETVAGTPPYMDLGGRASDPADRNGSAVEHCYSTKECMQTFLLICMFSDTLGVR
jgi:hypothetical protein